MVRGDDTVMHVLVIEDELHMANNIRAILAGCGHTADCAGLAEDGESLGRDTHYDLILLDLTLPDRHGVWVLRNLRAAGVDAPVLVVSGDATVEMRVKCLEAGADDYLIKPFHCSELAARVKALTRRMGTTVREAEEAREALEKLAGLTAREREVLDHLVAGGSNKEVALELNISPRTVEIHRAHIKAKTKARNIPDMVRIALAAARIKTDGLQNDSGDALPLQAG